MTFATQVLRQSVGRVLRLQTALTLTVAAIFLSGLELSAGALKTSLNEASPAGIPPAIFYALSALYGGAVTVVSTWWLARRFEHAGELVRDAPARAQRLMLAAVAQRWLLSATLLLAGLLALRGAPLPMLLGFAVAQGGYLAKVYPQR